MKSTGTTAAPLRNAAPGLDKEVAAITTALIEALDGHDAAQKAGAGSEKNLGKWRAEFAELSHADSCDGGKMSRRAQLREQIEVAQLHKSEQESVDLTAGLEGPLNACFRLFEITASREASASELYGREVLGEFFYHDESRVTQCLQSIPIIVDLKSVNRLWNFNPDRAALARKFIPWLEALARNENPWGTAN